MDKSYEYHYQFCPVGGYGCDVQTGELYFREVRGPGLMGRVTAQFPRGYYP